MLMLQGTVINVFQTPEGKDRETGEPYGGEWKVQLQVKEHMRNGEKRINVQTLTTKEPEKFRKLEDQTVSVPVGVIASNNGRTVPVRFFMSEGDIQTGNGNESKSDKSFTKPLV